MDDYGIFASAASGLRNAEFQMPVLCLKSCWRADVPVVWQQELPRGCFSLLAEQAPNSRRETVIAITDNFVSHTLLITPMFLTL